MKCGDIRFTNAAFGIVEYGDSGLVIPYGSGCDRGINGPRTLMSMTGELDEFGKPRILGWSGGIGMVGLLFRIIDWTGAGPLGV